MDVLLKVQTWRSALLARRSYSRELELGARTSRSAPEARRPRLALPSSSLEI